MEYAIYALVAVCLVLVGLVSYLVVRLGGMSKEHADRLMAKSLAEYKHQAQPTNEVKSFSRSDEEEWEIEQARLARKTG